MATFVGLNYQPTNTNKRKRHKIIMNKILRFVSNIFYPVSCISCGGFEDNKIFCGKCLELLNKEAFAECEKCKNPPDLCNCRKLLHIDEIFYKYFYRGVEIKKAIYKYKRANLYYINEFFAKDMFTLIEKSDRINIDELAYVTNVPRRTKSVRHFGYDQTKNLAKIIAKYAGVPYKPLLRTKGKAQEQKKLNYRERVANVKNRYVPVNNGRESEYNVLLIDDIMATGSTLSECARVLKNTGAKKVYALCIASIAGFDYGKSDKAKSNENENNKN